jgi:hypothetical protein
MDKQLIPDHCWALMTMDHEGGLDMSFWETHDEAKKALLSWWTFGDKEEIAELNDEQLRDQLRAYCEHNNVFWWIVPARYFNIALMGSQPWAVKLNEFWESESNYSTDVQAFDETMQKYIRD